MSIQQKIKETQRAIMLEIGQTKKPVTDQVQALALAAIKEGREAKTAWKNYMKQFIDADDPVKSPKQLARLMGEDDTKDNKEMDDKRAYLIADGTCTVETVTNFGRNASIQLDVGLEEEPA